MSSVVKFVGKQYLALIITALMVLTVTIPGEKSYLSLEDEEVVFNQLGGGGSLEERCSSITFEDILPYTHAHFDIVVDDDWDSAEVKARAWINGTSVDLLREKLDSYLEELYPVEEMVGSLLMKNQQLRL